MKNYEMFMTFKPDPKPKPRKRKPIRTIDPEARKVKLLAERTCRGVNCISPATEAHHIVRRGSPHFGDDVTANLLPLCMYCHHDWHAGRKPALEIRSDEILYVLTKLGHDAGCYFLEEHYGYQVPGDE